ncbi:MAG TPA: BMP family ABC transporter substrate-binding protein [Chthonomonadales bacterium]|nr:BMP family ABC transporter substrate-binding protein [Chthonomonadales bacterium]
MTRVPKRSLWTAALLAVAALAPTGCGRPSDPRGPASAPTRTSLSAAMVTDTGGIDDKSFNASAWEGLQRAYRELRLEGKPRYIESREQRDYETNLSTLAEQGNDVVVAVGYMMEDALKAVAPRYPNTRFVIVDGNAPDLPNCVAIQFREHEACFLAGYLAARMSRTGVIAFVGGKEGGPLIRFQVGYIAGAKAARRDIRVLVKYVGNFGDTGKGAELGRQAIQEGADVVMAAAGTAGLGVLKAVADRGPGYYAIGVDRDQDDLHPGRILTSVMKGVDSGVFEAIRSVAEDRWQSGTRVLGLKEDGMRLSPMRFTRQDVPADVLSRLDAIAAKIKAGDLRVPQTEEELQNMPLDVIP